MIEKAIETVVSVLSIGLPVALCVGVAAFLGEAARWYWADWCDCEDDE